MTESEQMYRNNARYYDLIYSWKDYKKEVEATEKLIVKYKRSKGKKLLDVGCGSGQHITFFKKHYTCTGVDVNKGILKEAKKKHPGVTFIKQSMDRLQTGARYDIITCLFSSIGYVKTRESITITIRKFSDHLVPGGVVIIEPWLAPDIYKVGMPHMTTYDGKDVKIARLNVSKAKGDISILDMHWLVAEKGKDVKYFHDVHELRMTPIKELIKIMKVNGLRTTYLKNKDRGLLVGVKA